MLTLTWHQADPDVLHFERPGGWHSITNFDTRAVDLPTGSLLLASQNVEDGRLPPDTTAWLLSGTPQLG
jgi:alpha-glucosidase